MSVRHLPRVLAEPPGGEAVRQLDAFLERDEVLLTVGVGDFDDRTSAGLEGAA